MRVSLVAALVSCAEGSRRAKMRHFLLGLSSDELEFIAEYVGCRLLDLAGPRGCSRAQLARSIAEFQQSRQGMAPMHPADQEHKMILLLEFLCQTGMRQAPMTMRAGQAG